MFAYKKAYDVIIKQTSVCCSILLNPLYGISNLEIWNHGKKRKAILLLAC